MMRPGAGDRRALDAVQPDAAAADHRNRRSGFDPGGAEHRPEPGGDAAANQRGPVERHVVADLHQAVLVHQHLLGEGAAVDELCDRRPVEAEPWRVIASPGCAPVAWHSAGRPERQYSQWPQKTERHVMT